MEAPPFVSAQGNGLGWNSTLESATMPLRENRMPRYLPLQADAAYPEIKTIYSALEADLGLVPNYLKTLAHSPHFLEPVSRLYRQVYAECGLSEKLKQLVILKTCKLDRCRATVEWHKALAEQAGWTPQEMEAIDSFHDSDLFNHYEKDALTLVEYVLNSPDDIPEAGFWTTLDNHFTSDQVVEMITLIGFFNMINRFLLALQVEADPLPVESS